MAVELAVAYVNLVPSAKGMKKGVEDELRDVPSVGDKTGRETGKKFVGAFGVEAQKLQDTGKKMAAVGAVIGGGLFAAASAAGNLEAALSANVQVLGDASQAVQDFAKRGVEEVGLSERAVLQAGTAFGQLGKVAGKTGEDLSSFSIDMVKLAADLAAFADVPADQAVQDLRSAFAGSTETMQKYNVFLNETELKSALYNATGEKVTGTLTSQQRVLATHAALMAQTGDIQGQAAREADGFQRAQDNLKATLENTGAQIGSTLLPVATRMIGAFSQGASAVGRFDRATGGMIGTLGGVSAGMLALGGGSLYVIGRINNLRQSFRTMSTASKRAAAGFAALSTAVALYAIHQQRIARNNQAMIDSFGELSRVTDAEVIDTFRESLAAGTFAGKDFNEVLAELAKSNIEGARRLLEIGEASGFTAEQTDALAAAIAEEERARAQATKTTEVHGDALDADTEAAKENAGIIAGPLRTAQNDYVRGLQQKNAELRASQRELEGSNWYIRKQAEDAENASRKIDNLRDAHADLRGELSDRSAYLDLQDAFDNVAQAATDAYTAAAEGSDDAEQRARDYERAQIDLKGRILDYIDTLDGIPPEVASDIVALVDEGKLAEAEAKLQSLTRQRYADVQVRIAGGRVTRDGGIDFGGGVVASASGRFVPGGANMLTTVGERGGRAGDEVILPLANPQRMAELIGHPRVTPAILGALADLGGGSSVPQGAGPLIAVGEQHIHNDVDMAAFWQQANAVARIS